MMSLARVSPREPRVTWMERHFKHTQTFIPLGGKPFIMVLAPPGEGDLPNPDDVRAMQFDGQAGFMMHLKTWHEFPFAIQANTDVIVVLRNETMSDLQQLEDDEAVGDDLEKRHMGKRLGVRFEFEMP
jgi:ureidoglycolate lyase